MKRSYYPTLKAGALARVVCYATLLIACFALAFQPQSAWWPLIFGATGLTAFVFTWLNRKETGIEKEDESALERPLRWGLAGIVFIGIFLRFFRLNGIPYGVWFDEAQNTIVTRQILDVPGYWPIFIPDFTQLPAFAFYLYSPFVALFPERVYGIRFVAACFGVGAIVVTFFLARELFNKQVALLAAFFLAISRWHITFSRFGMCQILSTFFFPLVIYYYVKAGRTKKAGHAIACGLLLGLTLQTYYVTIVLIPLLAFAFIWALLNGNQRPSFRQMALVCVMALVTYAPLMYFAYHNWEAFTERFRTVSDVSPLHVIDLGRGLLAGELNENGRKVYKAISDHLLMFNVSGDANGRHNLPHEPMLDPLMGTLFLIGAFATLIGIRREQNGTLLLWLGGVLSAGIFSLGFEAPQAGRTIPLTPLVAIVAARGAFVAFRGVPISHEIFAKALAVAGLLFCAFWNVFLGYKQIVNPTAWASYSTVETKIGELLATNGENRPVLVPEILANGPTQQLLASKSAQVYQTVNELVVPRGVEGASIVLAEEPFEHLDYLKKMYPRAAIEDFRSPPSPFEWATTAAKVLTIPKADIEKLHTPGLSCRDNAELVEASQGTIDWEVFRERYRCMPAWRAGINNDTHSFFTFRIDGTESVSLFVNHEKVLEGMAQHTRTLALPAGFHLVELFPEEGAQGNSTVSITRAPTKDSTSFEPVDLDSAAIYEGGLTGSYYRGYRFAGFPQIVRNDPNLHIYFHYLPLELPFSVRWKGFLRISEDGLYSFVASSIDNSKVYIDGNLIIDQLAAGEGVGAQINLKAGSVPITVEYAAITGYSQIMLQWQQPGETSIHPIPAKYFVPASILENQ